MSINYNPLGTQIVGDFPNAVYPNLADVITINGRIKESNPPQVVQTGDAPESGGPSNTPKIAAGDIRNTTILKSNQSREHVCDFVLELQKNIELKKFLKATAKQIRDAIRAVLRALGISDVSGKSTELFNSLKAFARELRRIQKEIIQPILDFQNYVLGYITKIRAMIQYILSLPAKLLALLADCLQRLLKLIGNIFTDFLKEFSPSSPGEDSGFESVIKAAQEVADEASNTIRKSAQVVATAGTIAFSATAGLLVPVSAEELAASNAFIANYEAANPLPSVNNILAAGTNVNQLNEVVGDFPDSNKLNNTIENNPTVTV
jgi:hypothetical protein